MDGGFIERFVHTPPRPEDHPALVLNADYRPLSWLPLSLWRWQEAVKAVWLDRVDILAEYEDAVVHSPSITMRLPSVIVLREYIRPLEEPAFTRFNLFLRDGFTCQYCGGRGDLTFDHVVPRARGGRTTWENVVAACGPCNIRKGARSLEEAGMRLSRRPKKPSMAELQAMARRFPPGHLHESWLDFLYWDAELEA